MHDAMGYCTGTGAACALGIAYTIAKPATQIFPPLFLASICYALTAIALFRPWSGLQTSIWTILVAGTLSTTVQSALIFSGIALVPASMATLVVQSQVPFAVLAASAIGKGRLNVRRVVGIAVAIFGVALIIGQPDSIGDAWGLLMIVTGTAALGGLHKGSSGPEVEILERVGWAQCRHWRRRNF